MRLALVAGWLLAPLAGAIVGGARGLGQPARGQRRPDRRVRLVPASRHPAFVQLLPGMAPPPLRSSRRLRWCALP